MRIVDRVENVSRGREIKAAGTVCMAAAWILFATPAPAQDASGMAQNGANLNRRRGAGGADGRLAARLGRDYSDAV